VDSKNDRVEEFDPQGEYVRSFGYEGASAGAFREPHGIAVDSKGKVWVADTGNNRIEEFTETGEYVRETGSEGIGQLKAPQGIAIDASGDVWVTDTGDNRVVEFNEKGEYLRETSKTVGTKTLSEPLGIAIDKSGDAWVADAKNHRIVEFGPTGSALKEFGSQGTANGEFETPAGIAIDSEGNMWVTDYVNNRVQEFNSKGEYLTKFGSEGSNGGQFNKPYFVAVDTRGDLAVADSENSRVQRWAHATWYPSTSEGPAATSKVTYTYKTVLVNGGTETRPVKVVAPHLSELSCEPTISRGCYVLIFKYDEKTTAGENESEWGEYDGRLKEVLFAAYNPSVKEVQEISIAQYAYDAQGRLRAEWDPRISPALKTVYGYDAEGHVTAVSPPGQEPWLLHYGTIPTDASAGRLLSLTRPAATTELGSRIAPQNTSLPTLSTSTPTVGSKISVSSNGSWNNAPLAYSYQWEDCNSSGAECSAIPGAVNESYYPMPGDEKHELVAQVSAINAGGTTVVASAATALVGSGTPYSPAPEPPNPGTSALTTIEYAVPLSGTGLQNLTATEVEKGWGQKDDPVEGTAIFPPDTPMGWPAKEYTKATISYFDSEGHTVNTVNPSGGVSTTEYNTTNNVVRTLSPDNRTLALKEGAKSVEVAANLDDRSVYNAEGDELMETLGPEHKIKLVNGSEVQARRRVKYSYDRNAPKTGGPYRLLTGTVESALVGGEEKEQRITQTNYYGQKGLGWTLRKPTSTVVDPYGLKLTTTTVYNPQNGAVVETGGPEGVQEKEITERPTYSSSFGSYGTGAGQLVEPADLTVDSSGNVWVADEPNNRIQEFNSKGEFVRQVGSDGTGSGHLKEPYGVAVDSKGDVWVADTMNARIDEFTSEGTFVKAFGWGVSNGESKLQTCTSSCRAGIEGSGNGEFYIPEGITTAANGDLYVCDRGNKRIQEFTSEGTYIKSFTDPEEKGGPTDVALNSSGDLWATYASYEDSKIVEFNPEGTIIDTFGREGSGQGELLAPQNLAVGPEGNIWLTEYSTGRVQVFSQTGEYLYGFGGSGQGEGQFFHPRGIGFYNNNAYVLDSGEWWITSGNNRVEKWHIEPPASYSSSFGSYGTGAGQLVEPADLTVDSSGNVWVADEPNNRIQEFNSKGEFVRQVGSDGTSSGHLKEPYGVAVDSKGDVWVADTMNARIDEFTSEGTFVKAFGWGVSNGESKLQTCTSSCRAGIEGSGNGEFYIPEGITTAANGDLYVCDRGNKRIQEFTSEGTYIKSFTDPEEKGGPTDVALNSSGDLWATYASYEDSKIVEFNPEGTIIDAFGSKGSGPAELLGPQDLAIGPEGNIWLTEYGTSRVQVFSQTGEYLYGFGKPGQGEGQFLHPRGIGFYNNNVYVLDSGEWWITSGNNRIEKWEFNQETVNTKPSHDKQIIYYTAETNAKYPACGGHVEWEGMPCETLPGAQPEGSSAPPIPATTITSYNMWGEPETSEETFGTTKRTKKTTYDEAGRVLTTEETATSDSALPKVSDTYSETTGQLTEESTTVGEEKQTITSKYDKLGRLTSYTDADKNTTTYEYESSGDGRLITVSDEKGSQSYAYEPATGELDKLLDSAAKTFTASYDVEGNMTSETYPNGMTATYTRDPAGETTGLEYAKTSHCTEKCTWFNETTAPSIHGETLSRSSTLASENYTYDAAGRLTQTTETPIERGCTTRIYSYDEDSNRTSLTTREPGTGGKCATEGGTTETHTYDSGDRLTDTGVSYDPLGNITKLPASDAGGHELTSEYYADGQVQKQTQNGQTNTYFYDPAGRIRKTIAEGTTKLTTINHYAGPDEALTWKEEGEKTGKYTRLIPGIDGSLAATQTSSGEVILQLHDLQGNIVATAALSETETKLLSTYNSTEFGVPVNGAPPMKYSWLGSEAVSSELSSGTVVMGTVAYVPQLGRPLQTIAVTPPGTGVNAAAGTPYVVQISPLALAATTATGEADAHAHQAALEEAARREAEEKACAIASECVVPEEGEVVDPSILLTSRQSEALAYGLRYGGKVLEEAVRKVPVASVLVKIIVELGSAIATELAEGLEGCYTAINSYEKANARCKVYINLLFDVIPTSWGVETCFAKAYNRSNKVHYTYPYCTKA
jgi:YD repeat-containing protein